MNPTLNGVIYELEDIALQDVNPLVRDKLFTLKHKLQVMEDNQGKERIAKASVIGLENDSDDRFVKTLNEEYRKFIVIDNEFFDSPKNAISIDWYVAIETYDPNTGDMIDNNILLKTLDFDEALTFVQGLLEQGLLEGGDIK